MSGKLFASLTCAALLAGGVGYASASDARTDEWTHETRQVGNKVTIDVYHRKPYALTGRELEASRPSPSGEWKHETRQLGDKVTIDVYHR